MSILAQISSPRDLKALDIAGLESLAQEIRDFIIGAVSRTGGHLASSLGAVELTLALHYVFDTPRDKLLWDVGHQAYPHKIITGRKERFPSLRQLGGIGPFINPCESPYDAFIAGHAGNAVSAASGVCEAMAKAGGKNRVIAIIGDGSLSNGLTFEGLNYVGTKRLNLIVVLNDNNMFISPRVGAIADYLSRIMTSKRFRDMKEGLKSTLQRIPRYGDHIYKLAKHIEGNLKGVVTEGLLFEEMGFRYIGPIDGHRIDHLLETFQNISLMEGPIFLHVVTQKGRGYAPAVQNPETFHGIGCFHQENGESAGKAERPSYSDVFGKTIERLAKRDPRIVAISAAMTSGTGLKGFSQRYPERFFDVGIAEGHAVTMAAGMAAYGLRPVVAIYSTFLQRAYDEIIHDVAIQNLPVIFAVDRAGIVGADGPTHHGVFDLAFFRSVPNMTLMVPRDQLMLVSMLIEALRLPGPVAIRYPRGTVEAAPLKSHKLRTGRAEIIRPGQRAVVFCLGPLCYIALKAVSGLEGVAVVDLIYAKPLDTETIRELVQRAGGRFVVVEDGAVQGGVGSAILELLADLACPLSFRLLGVGDTFVGHGNQQRLMQDLGLDAGGIRQAVLSLL